MQAGKGICLSHEETTRKETEIVKKQGDVQAVRKEAGVEGPGVLPRSPLYNGKSTICWKQGGGREARIARLIVFHSF